MFLVVVILFATVGFWIKGVLMLDPDFGWHLKLGELIVKQGFPKTDPFSYSMPSYPFVDYEWGSNVLIYLGYMAIGRVGLAAIYALMAVGALWLVVGRKGSYSLISVMPVLFGATVMVGAVGVRPQVISWLFLAILVKLVGEETVWRKWNWALPLLMIVWVNFHGSYPIGLLIAGLMIILRWYQKKNIIIQDVIILLLSIAATMVNPYGWRNGFEVIRQMILGGELMRKGISEWMPWHMASSMAFVMLVGLGVVLSLRYWRKIDWGEMGAAGALALAGIASLRNMSLFAVVAVLLVTRGLKQLGDEAKSVGAEKRFAFVIKILIVISVIVLIGEGTLVFARTQQISEEAFYPKEAVEFLKRKNYSGRLFSEYGWGGYLIWKYPEKKVYIDGRMSNFVWRAPEGEADYVFKEYLELKKGQRAIDGVFKKYKVEIVLWPTRDAKETKNSNLFSWLWGNKDNEKNFLKRLEQAGWTRVYKDHLAIIYRKSSN